VSSEHEVQLVVVLFIFYRVIVDRIDKNNDGFITKKELVEWILYVSKM